MHGYLAAMRNYGRFRGRAPLAEFWGFFLVVSIVGLVLQRLVDPGRGGSLLSDILLGGFVLVHLMPTIAVLARRLHDIDASGWWSLIGLVPFLGFVMLIPAAFKATVGPNRFGPDPLDPSAIATAGTRGNPSGVRRDPPFSAPPRPAAEPVDVLAQLEKLARLRDDGTLSADEFDAMKARLLASGRAG